MPTPLNAEKIVEPTSSGPNEWEEMVKLCHKTGFDAGRPSQWNSIRTMVLMKALERIEALEAKSGG